MMDQEVVQFLKSLILPPGGIILLGLLGLMFSRRFLGRFLITLSLAALYILSTPFVSEVLMTGLESYPALDDKAISESGAGGIVVLGGGRYSDAPEYGGDTVNGIALVRIRYAAWLSRKTGLPVIPSGGIVSKKDEIAEGVMAAEILEKELGVKVAGIEQQSRNTWENAFMTRELLAKLGIDRVFLVTHAWHMPRALGMFEKAGVNAVPAPTGFVHKDPERAGFGFADRATYGDWLPNAGALLKSYFALHEYLGRVWYQFRNWLG